ncbi:MAG: patatin-like phospholipase family protein [Pseudomonadota bacterium]
MTSPRIGIALGGGGARGLAHIPMIEVLDEFDIIPSIIAGCSIGAFIGAGYAAGMTGKEMREYAATLFSDRTTVIQKLWTLRPKKFTDLFQGGITLTQFDAEPITELFLPDTIPETFDGLGIPLTIVACDYYGWSEAVIKTGNVRSAISGSIAIPVLFKPVLREDRVLIDGGAVNPLPIDQARPHADIVIAVDVVGGPKGAPPTIPNNTESIFGATQLLMQSIASEKLKQAPADILIRPNIDIFRVLDFFKVMAIFKSADASKDALRRELDTALSAWAKGPAELQKARPTAT